MNILLDLGIIVFFSSVLSVFFNIFHQPFIPAYILTGIILGSSGLNLISEPEIIKVLSELGIAFLLFMTGLEFDLDKVKRLGRNIVLLGVFQIIITASLGFTASMFLGFDKITSIIIGIMLSFSSTAIVVKSMRDINQITTLHGRIVLGLLLVQDFFAILILSFISAGVNLDVMNSILKSIFYTTIILFLSLFFRRYINPLIIRKLSEEYSLLFLYSLSVLFIFGVLSYIFGIPISIGAFLAGISMAVTPYNIEISSNIKSLKEFFSVLFFVSLGLEANFNILTSQLVQFTFLLLFILLVKPLIVYILMSIFEYERKTSYFTSVYISQISEFSLILAIELFGRGLISSELMSLVILLVLFSLFTTPYYINYSSKSFLFLDNKILKGIDGIFGFGRKHFSLEKLSRRHKNVENHVILCGLNTTGLNLMDYFKKNNIPFVVIDFDPEKVEKYYKEGINILYGDVTHPEVLKHANIEKSRLVISNIPHDAENQFLISFVKKHGNPKIIVRASDVKTAIKYYNMGPDFVFVPKIAASMKLIKIMDMFLGNKKKNIEKIKKESLDLLKKLYLHEILNYKKEKILDLDII